MSINFQIKALPAENFNHLFNLDKKELKNLGAIRMTVDKKPGFPCRVSLKDAEVGQEVLLFSYQHHKTYSPYQASGPVFVTTNAIAASPAVNEIPEILQHRFLSIRAYDEHGMMKASSVVEGHGLKNLLLKIFEADDIAYIHIHNAKAGCYNCLVERA
ncbi:MAG: DUF1203 domain-containing protein [Ginsengibacter sp.]